MAHHVAVCLRRRQHGSAHQIMVRPFALLLAFVVHVSSKKVQVQIFTEAGCPFCSKYLAGPLKHALADKQTADLMDVDVSPFGNAFFHHGLMDVCRGEASNKSSWVIPQYDVGMRNCFNKQCGPSAANRPAGCFAGELVCQHGGKECSFDRYFACAKHVSPKTESSSSSPQYISFIHCMEASYTHKEVDPHGKLLTSCAKVSGISSTEIRSCYGSKEGDDAVKKEAMATPVHPGVPFVLVNGKQMKESYDADALIKAVRQAASAKASFLDKSFH